MERGSATLRITGNLYPLAPAAVDVVLRDTCTTAGPEHQSSCVEPKDLWFTVGLLLSWHIHDAPPDCTCCDLLWERYVKSGPFPLAPTEAPHAR